MEDNKMCWKKALCLILGGFFIFSNIVCQQPAASAVPAEETVAPTSEPTATIAVETKVTEVEETEEVKTPIPTPEPTEVPSPEPTPEPTDTPAPTRAPMEGDITDRFPDYDTGVDADYSYQSDELRIAIKKYVNPHDPDIHETYYIADIWIRNINYFRTGFGRGEFNTGREDGEEFAVREHAILATNGTMNTGLVFHNGKQFKNVNNSANMKKNRYGVFILYKDGTMKTFDTRTEKLNFKKEVEAGAVHAWQFGPILIRDGEIPEQFSTKGTRHPRIMVGYYEPGHYVVVAVDGRNKKKAIGMNDYEMAQLMKELGCQEAMNFDGGTSAMMVFMGTCISNPSGADTDGDGKAGRAISDMLLFAEYDAEGNAPSLQEVDMNRIRNSSSK